MTIIAIDVGNTRAKLGIWDGQDALTEPATFRTAIPLQVDTDLPTQVQRWIKQTCAPTLKTVMIAGSNPAPVHQLLNGNLSRKYDLRPIQSYQQIPLKMGVRHPETVGIDRLLTAVAVRAQQVAPSPSIVVDAGTATTVNLTMADGTFCGGAILPGMRMSARALHDYTAALPLVDADALVDESKNPEEPVSQEMLPQMPGNDTASAIQNGLFWGHLGSLKELIARLQSHLASVNETTPASITMTGGGGRQLADFIPGAVYHDSLALTGLAVLSRAESKEK